MYELRLAQRAIWMLAMALFFSGCQPRFYAAKLEPQIKETVNRSFSVVHVNDVYRIEGVDEGRLGGLARVRAVRAELERDGTESLFLHGGRHVVSFTDE